MEGRRQGFPYRHDSGRGLTNSSFTGASTMLELLITAVTLAIVPYVLIRGTISRIAKLVFAPRPAMKQRAIR
jgi:hypothetical protein